MSDRSLFGTDGVRGRANRPPMTPEVALALGRAVGAWVRLRAGSDVAPPPVAIGADTRASGPLFEHALTAGLLSMGCDVLSLGVLPTPGIALLTRTLGAGAGLVISASHNPFADNGIKVFGADGFKLADADERALDAWTTGSTPLPLGPADAAALGTVTAVEDAADRYVAALTTSFVRPTGLSGLTIVLDCAHGAAYRVAPRVLEALGAHTVLIGVEPDGRNINAGCGSLHPQGVAEAVRAHGAHLGVALDGDADRVILVDELGEVVDGDQVLGLCAAHLDAKQELAGRTVVATVMSNLGLEIALRERGVRLLRTPVGDRHVVAAMRAEGYVLGGEQSGHLVFLEHSSTGDGLLAALQVLAVMLEAGKPLSELKALVQPVPQLLINVRVRERPPLDTLPTVLAAQRAAEADLGDRGRVLLRYSGTELLARVMVEGLDAELVQRHARALAATLRSAIGAR